MTAKVNVLTAAPDVMKVWTGASLAIAASLEPSLIELVKIRASQINGCANCINMHTTEARRQGESEQRIYLLSAWREAPCYTERERAALGWTEALTRLSPRFKLEKQRGIELANAFYTASRSGDMSALGAMLAADVSVHADGGGKRPASPNPIFGFEEVMKLHAQLAGQFRTHQSKLVRTVFINGLPGFVTLEADGKLQTTTLDIEDGRVTAIYVVRNPDKLRHLH